jgi:hypothetical protein
METGLQQGVVDILLLLPLMRLGKTALGFKPRSCYKAGLDEVEAGGFGL